MSIPKEFLAELGALLYRHNATILRSANKTNDLVVSILDKETDMFTDCHFEEEITPADIYTDRFRIEK